MYIPAEIWRRTPKAVIKACGWTEKGKSKLKSSDCWPALETAERVFWNWKTITTLVAIIPSRIELTSLKTTTSGVRRDLMQTGKNEA